MGIAEDFFRPWESTSAEIADWRSMLDQVNRVLDFAGKKRTLAWRGLSDATYAANSTLYRHVSQTKSLPEESDLVAFELAMLKVARTRWRFDDRPALELLAQLQHLGAPTRLIDVTFNPLIALWFAVEAKFDDKNRPKADIDGRLIAYDVTDRQIELDNRWGNRRLPWETEPKNWRDGLPLVWRPPSYNDRIPAQDSGFLLGGVPGSRNMRWYRKRSGDNTGAETWRMDEVRQATSVPMRMYSLDSQKPLASSTPTFTIRIPRGAKNDIRFVLDRSFGINTSSVYPDMYGLAQRGFREVEVQGREADV